MNSEIFTKSFIITFVYIALKIIEVQMMTSNESEVKPLKTIVRDAIVVFFSSCIGIFAAEQISELSNDSLNVTKVFTNTPDF
jgi:hypothetical protein